MNIKQAHLPAGTIEYVDTEGVGPVVVLCHGLLMDHTVWAHVIPALASVARVIAPTLPVGSHRLPMDEDADLSLNGQATILGDFIEQLALEHMTLVVSDLGYPLVLAAKGHAAIDKLVILPCELYDNIPPGLPGKVVSRAAHLPGGLFMAVQTLLLPGAASLPLTLGRMARHVPRSMLRGWVAGPRKSKAVRQDLVKYIRATDLDDLLSATEDLATFARPTLVLWSRQDRVMPYAHAIRLTESMRSAELLTFETGKTLLQLDQPTLVAEHLTRFVTPTSRT